MISLLVEQINLYAIRNKNMQTFKTNKAEIKKFLDVLLLSGYHNLFLKADYWNAAEDLEAPIYSKIMVRDCFVFQNHVYILLTTTTLHNLKWQRYCPYWNFANQFPEVWCVSQKSQYRRILGAISRSV